MARLRKQTSGKWLVETSWYDTDGKRHYKSKGGLPTKQAARKVAAELDAARFNGEISDKDYSFVDYYQLWFDTYKKGHIALATERRYMNDKKFLQKYFGQRKMNKVTHLEYQKFINSIGENHAPSTVRKMNAVVRECVKSAIVDGVITKNFSERIKLGGDEDRALHVEYLSIAEIKPLVSYLEQGLKPGYTSRYMILTAIYTGARLGEIMALTWNDINFNFKTITINKAWDYLGGGRFKKAKTKSSVRTIRVNSNLLNVLKQLKQNNKKMVFENQIGTIPTSNAVNKTLHQALNACDISKKNFHFHSLRHSHVAYLLANDVPLYAISKRLGHSNTTITASKYAYLIDEFKAQSDDRIEECLNKIEDHQSAKQSANLKISSNS